MHESGFMFTVLYGPANGQDISKLHPLSSNTFKARACGNGNGPQRTITLAEGFSSSRRRQKMAVVAKFLSLKKMNIAERKERA